jgi:hypothetical protein
MLRARRRAGARRKNARTGSNSATEAVSRPRTTRATAGPVETGARSTAFASRVRANAAPVPALASTPARNAAGAGWPVNASPWAIPLGSLTPAPVSPSIAPWSNSASGRNAKRVAHPDQPATGARERVCNNRSRHLLPRPFGQLRVGNSLIQRLCLLLTSRLRYWTWCAMPDGAPRSDHPRVVPVGLPPAFTRRHPPRWRRSAADTLGRRC